VHISLLGDLEVRADDDSEIVVRGSKLRALVSVLALNAGHPVAADLLVEALWGQDPPPAARNGVQGLVSKIRRA
jgi:DNA-binding SARP family transcriptional activator